MLNTLLLAPSTANVKNTFSETFSETLPKASLLKAKHCDMLRSSLPSCRLLHLVEHDARMLIKPTFCN